VQKALSEAGIDLSVCGEVTSEPSVGFFDNLARTLNLKDYDALVHAVESYFARKSNIVTEMFSLQAIELLGPDLERAVTAGDDMQAREAMQVGATMKLTDCGYRKDHLPAIVKGTLNSFQTANNPREITADDIVRIAEKLR